MHGAELGISIYRQNFEAEFLEQTQDFYRSLSRTWLAQDSFPDYLKKVEQCLVSEDSRIQEYLHNSSRDLVAKCVYTELLSNVREELLSKETGPVSLMAANSVEGTLVVLNFNLY